MEFSANGHHPQTKKYDWNLLTIYFRRLVARLPCTAVEYELRNYWHRFKEYVVAKEAYRVV